MQLDTLLNQYRPYAVVNNRKPFVRPRNVSSLSLALRYVTDSRQAISRPQPELWVSLFEVFSVWSLLRGYLVSYWVFGIASTVTFSRSGILGPGCSNSYIGGTNRCLGTKMKEKASRTDNSENTLYDRVALLFIPDTLPINTFNLATVSWIEEFFRSNFFLQIQCHSLCY